MDWTEAKKYLGGFAGGVLVVLAVALVVKLAGSGSSQGPRNAGPLDVSGDYNLVRRQRCYCPDRTCSCAKPGCQYSEQLSLSKPSETGAFQMTMRAADQGCYSGQMGPFDLDVDRCGTVFAGASWSASTSSFDPSAKDQEVDLLLAGSIMGFGGAPAGFKHTLIMRRNITVCDTEKFLEGSCIPGDDKFFCVERFASCAQGDCATTNKDTLSPSLDSFMPSVAGTGLNGTYQLSAADSSQACPPNITVYQFGAEVGLGWAQDSMQMTRLSAWLPEKDDSHECLSFFTACSGLQLDFRDAHIGSFVREKDRTVLSMYRVVPVQASARLALSKCVFVSDDPSSTLINVCRSEHTTVVVLSIVVGLMLVCAAGLLVCCLKYRRDYVDSKISRHYDVFQGIGNPGI
jgi:hypothetical protein